MPRTSPEKLAAALRANLKRRKASKGPESPQEGEKPTPAADPGDPEKAPSGLGEKAKIPSTKG